MCILSDLNVAMVNDVAVHSLGSPVFLCGCDLLPLSTIYCCGAKIAATGRSSVVPHRQRYHAGAV